MEDKFNWKLPVIVAVVVALALLVLWLYLKFFSKPSQPKTEEIPTGVSTPAMDDRTRYDIYDEPDTTVDVGTKGVLRGDFQKVEGGEIYFEGTEGATKMPLTEEVALICTKQELKNITELDYNEVTDVKEINPSEVSEKLNSGQPIVVFSQEEEGTLKVHTIAVPSSTCK